VRTKLLLSYIVLILVLTIPIGYSFNQIIEKNIMDQYQAHFESEIQLVKLIFEDTNSGETDYDQFVSKIKDTVDVRVTLIDMNGIVLADTEELPENMDNHLHREEVKNAIRMEKTATSVRYSNTLNTEYMYAATPVNRGEDTYILRISKPIEVLQGMSSKIEASVLTATLFGFVLAMTMAIFLTNRFTKPIYELTDAAEEIAKGKYGKKIYSNDRDQIGDLTRSFNQMSYNLGVKVNEITQRNVELEAILNSMINGIIAIDADRNILMINPISYEILNLPEGYIAENEPIYKVIRNEEIIELVEESIKSGKSQIEELSYVHLDKMLRIYVNPILTNSKEIIGSIVVIQDITVIRKLEQMRSDFVSNVSHELKTPLTSIKGFVDTLKNGAINDPETAIRFLDIIDMESERLYRLINDILILSEIERMDEEIDQDLVVMNEIIDEVIDMLSLKASEKGLDLIKEMDNLLAINGNRDRIKQLIINLVDNGIKYTEKGFVKILLSEENNYVKIQVIDTGIGIPDSHLERLFERFYRVDKGRSRNQGGTGLGLSIVKHIALLYKGKIDVHSKIGKGTEFDIYFPKSNKMN